MKLCVIFWAWSVALAFAFQQKHTFPLTKGHARRRSKIWVPTSDASSYLTRLEKLKNTSKFRQRVDNEKPRRRQKQIQQNWNDNDDDENEDDESLLVPVQQPVFQIILQRNGTLFGDADRPRHRTSSRKTSESGAFELEDVKGFYNFTSIGGYKELKKELEQIIHIVQYPQNYTAYGLRLPRGILLEGPPGNGKTLIAKCLAGEASMNFVSCSGAEFNEKYVGVGASRIRELFYFARQNTPCIIFIDELDAVGRTRSSDGENAHAERDQTLNQLLVMMDGFSTGSDVIVLSATNRADILDPALLRPGRIDKIIHVPHPDTETRREIIPIHLNKKPINATLDYLVRITNGMSGAQIENLFNEAVLYAVRQQSLPVQTSVLDMTKEKMLIGQTSGATKNMSPDAMKRIAVHEIGHVLMALLSQHSEKPWKVTIDSMNPKNSLGYTLFENDETSQGLFVREYYEDNIKVLLGGRAAEEVMYGNSISSGALSDLETAFSMAKKMIMEYGMGTDIIYPYFSETYKRRIDDQIHTLIARAYRETKQYLEKNRIALGMFSDFLLEKKTIQSDEIYALHRELFQGA